jgi:glycosyltransferase involved in cell wall biosynthesis
MWPDLPIAMGIIRNKLIKSILLFWERLVYRMSSGIVCLAPGIVKGVLQKVNIDASRIIMIPNGCDTSTILNLGRMPQKHLHVPAGKVIFGYTGTFGRANGLSAVLNGAKVLMQRKSDEIHFVLVGDGREKMGLMEMCSSMGLNNVTFKGLFDKSKYNEVLAEIDVGMQILLNIEAFYYGTSPNKFFDYLAAGKPVLVNYPGWMSDLVSESDCGIAVKPDDAVAFADAIQILASRKNDFNAMGIRARMLAEKEFSQTNILPRLVRFVENTFSRTTRSI